MESRGELAPGWRLLLAAAIVFSIPVVGFVLIYTSFLVLPMVVLIMVIIFTLRWLMQQKE